METEEKNHRLWFLCVLHIYVIFRPSEIIVFNTFYPIYFLALFVMFLNFKKLPLLFSIRQLKIIFIIIFSLSLLSVFNSYINDFYDRRLILNWIAWFIVLIAVTLSSPGTNKHLSSLELLAKSVLLIQLCITFIQIFYPDFFAILWNSLENRGLDRDVRVSGSLDNPIIFSYIVCYLVLIVIARKGPVRNIFWVILGCILVIMSGSRSLILTYPVLIGAWFYLSDDGLSLIKRLSFSFIYAVFLFTFSYALLYFFKEFFVYSAELLVMFSDGTSDLNSQALTEDRKELRTFGYRVDYWHAALAEFFSRDFLSAIFGKSGPYLTSPHHDLIYMLSRYGAVGLMFYLALHLWLFEIALKNKSSAEGRLLYLTILMSLTVGMANTIGVEMRLGILSVFVVGLLFSREMHLAEVNSNEKPNSNINIEREDPKASSTKPLLV